MDVSQREKKKGPQALRAAAASQKIIIKSVKKNQQCEGSFPQEWEGLIVKNQTVKSAMEHFLLLLLSE